MKLDILSNNYMKTWARVLQKIEGEGAFLTFYEVVKVQTPTSCGSRKSCVAFAYGLAGQEKKKDKFEVSESRSHNLEAIGALGIFDSRTAQALTIASYSEATFATGELNKEHLKSAMRWRVP
jgi:hypothetical protein